MKTIVSVLVAAAVLVALAGPADAGRKKKKKKHVKVYHYSESYSPRHYRSRGVIERQPTYDANKMPFGTLQWWDQMVREGRAR